MGERVLCCEFKVTLTAEERDLLIDLADEEDLETGEIVGKALKAYRGLCDLVKKYEGN